MHIMTWHTCGYGVKLLLSATNMLRGAHGHMCACVLTRTLGDISVFLRLGVLSEAELVRASLVYNV